MAERLSATEADEILGRWVRGKSWAAARQGGYRMALLWRLQGRNFRRLPDYEIDLLRKKQAEKLREYAAAIEGGDDEVVAIIEGWMSEVEQAEARHLSGPHEQR